MLLDAVIVEDRTGFAEPGTVMRIGGRQILDHADQSPSQCQAQTDQQQHRDRNIHGSNFKIAAFLGL